MRDSHEDTKNKEWNRKADAAARLECQLKAERVTPVLREVAGV